MSSPPKSGGAATPSPAHGNHSPQRPAPPHVLHVDDDPVVGRTIERMLSRTGFRVTSFTDPLVAMESFRGNPRAYDVLLTDLMMPGMNGVELSEAVLALHPKLPVIVLSGFTDHWTPERIAARGIRELLSKPVAVDHLVAAVRRALGHHHAKS